MDAVAALNDLTEISSQIEAAVLLAPDGTMLASTLSDAAADRLAGAVRSVVEDAAGLSAGPGLVQLEAATDDGSLFVVRDGERVAAAVTRPEPTAGLVFFDLKSCLRAVAAEHGDGKPRPRPRRKRSAPVAEAGE